MKRKILLKTVALIVLAVAISLVQYKYIRLNRESITDLFPAALQNITVGEPITKSDIKWVEVLDAGNEPLSLESIVGQYVKTPIEEGQIIYSNDLIESTFTIPNGYRAFSISLASDDLCNLHIVEGMIVDILVSNKDSIDVLESLEILDIMEIMKNRQTVSVMFLATMEQARVLSSQEKTAQIEVLMKPYVFAEQKDI